MKRKLLAWVLTLVMLLAMFPMSTLAAADRENFYIGGINMGNGTYTKYYKNGGATGTSSDYNAKIEKIDGKVTLHLKDLNITSNQYHGDIDYTSSNVGTWRCGIFSPVAFDVILEGENKIAVDKRPRGAAYTKQQSSADEKVAR